MLQRNPHTALAPPSILFCCFVHFCCKIFCVDTLNL